MSAVYKSPRPPPASKTPKAPVKGFFFLPVATPLRRAASLQVCSFVAILQVLHTLCRSLYWFLLIFRLNFPYGYISRKRSRIPCVLLHIRNLFSYAVSSLWSVSGEGCEGVWTWELAGNHGLLPPWSTVLSCTSSGIYIYICWMLSTNPSCFLPPRYTPSCSLLCSDSLARVSDSHLALW